MRKRLALLIGAALLASSAVPAAADRGEDVRLVGVTQVVTSTSGTLDVVLPRTARVDLRRGVRFEGAGRLLGLELVRMPGSAGPWGYLQSYRLPAFAGGEQVTWGSTPAAECRSTPSEQLPLWSDCTGAQPPTAIELPAGRYRLTLLSDDRPIRVTLVLQGLEESTTLRPTTSLASVQKQLPVREQAAGGAVTFGDSADLGAPVRTLLVARADRSGAAQWASSCTRPDAGTAPGAFGPHCPGGSSGSFSYSAGSLLAGGSAFASSSSADDHGVVGLGGSFAGSEGVRFEQALGVWLETR